MTAYVEIQGTRIGVDWKADSKQEWQRHLAAMKTVPARKFKKAGKTWTVPLDMSSCYALRRAFDKLGLKIGPNLRSWAIEAKRAEAQLGNLSNVMSAELTRLPALLPFLYRALYLGPLYKNATKQLGYDDATLDYAASLFSAVTGVDYWDGWHGSYQTADVAFMANSPAPGNFNHQGLGKTPVTIGAIYEAGLAKGTHLIITPTAAVESVWADELCYWQQDSPYTVDVFACTGTKRNRELEIEAFQASDAEVRFLVVNPAMIMWRKDKTNRSKHTMEAKPKNKPPKSSCKCGAMKSAHWHYEPAFPFLENHKWTTVTNDEAHQGGNVRNHRSLSAKSINELSAGKRHALTGTPMNGIGSDIWGILHFLRPDVFTSFWAFAQRYFEVDKDGFGWTVGGLMEDREQDFFDNLTQYALRRTKKECLRWLPDKQHIDVWVQLEGEQAKTYRDMEANGFVAMDGGSVSATSILAEMTRLTQFARTVCRISDAGKVVPTIKGAKIDALLNNLENAGVLDGTSPEPHLVFSESRQVVELLADHLDSLPALAGRVGRITGANAKERPDLVRRFQNGELAIMVIVVTAGGVALTLDEASTCHFLDEAWTPNVDEQAEDRAHRGSRMHQVTIYHYRTRDSIDEDRMAAAASKDDHQKYILDVRRAMKDRIEGS